MNLRQTAIIATIAALVVFALGYYAGHSRAPAKVVEKTRDVIKTVTVEDTHAQEQVRELTAKLEELKRHTVVQRVVYLKPDGTKETHETETVDVQRATEVKADTTKHLDVTMNVKADAVEKVATQTTVTNGLEWFAGAVVAASPTDLKNLSAGVMVGRHILGPVAIGVSAVVPVNKPVSVPVLGLSVTMGF